MRRLNVLMTVALLLAATSANARVSRSVCDPDAFKDYISDNSHLFLTLATLRLVNRENFGSFKRRFGSDITIPIQGRQVSFGEKYDTFDRRRNHVLSEYRYHATEDQSRSYLQFTFSGLS